MFEQHCNIFVLTIINIKNKQLFSFSQRRDDIDFQLFCGFLNFPNIALVILVSCSSGKVLGEIDIEVIENIREELQFCVTRSMKRWLLD